MTQLTLGQRDVILNLTYDLESSTNGTVIFSGAGVNSPTCIFDITGLDIKDSNLNWLTQTRYHMFAKHRDSTAPAEEFIIIVLRDANDNIISGVSCFNRTYETWVNMEPDRCCPRPSIVYI